MRIIEKAVAKAAQQQAPQTATADSLSAAREPSALAKAESLSAPEPVKVEPVQTQAEPVLASAPVKADSISAKPESELISSLKTQPMSVAAAMASAQSMASESLVKPVATSVESEQRQISLDLARWGQVGGVTPSAGKTPLAESFRLIKRPLIANAFNKQVNLKHGNLIMVTSSVAGEGKSFCAINLAMSIASEMDHTVLLVDGDIARPTLPQYLGFSAGSGLLDVLAGHADLSEVICRTNVEKLSIISAGKNRLNSTELLASQNMSRLLDELSSRYADRVIIFDSPPLLLATEASAMAMQMGQVVMVVEAEKTTQKVVLEALQQIEMCEVVNLLYNKAPASLTGGYYGQGRQS